MEELGATVLKIQRSTDGVNWTTTKTYTREEYSKLVKEDAITHWASFNYTGASGYYYRSYVELYAKDSSGRAYMPEYSNVIRIGG